MPYTSPAQRERSRRAAPRVRGGPHKPFVNHPPRTLPRMQTDRARQLRRDMTDAERLLWLLLRNRRLADCKFRRQHPIGPYIADFARVQRRLIVEADGGQHGALRAEADAHRTEWLQAQGWRVLRFWNDDVLRRQDAVVDAIWRVLAGAEA
jgi:very-short-patch-repair endonuclease